MNTIPINIQIEPNEYGLQIEGTETIPIQLETAVQIISGDHYHGAYTFTPTNEVQVVDIHGLVADEDIVIDAIPSNYGLVEWDGSILTVK